MNYFFTICDTLINKEYFYLVSKKKKKKKQQQQQQRMNKVTMKRRFETNKLRKYYDQALSIYYKMND